MALLFKNGLVVTPNGVLRADLRTKDHLISEIADTILAVSEDEIIDCTGKIVMPGVIDAHVHYYLQTSPGKRTADDFSNGSKLAALGGVTSFIDFAEALPEHTLLESLQLREQEAKGNSWLDYHFHMEVSGGVRPEDFSQLKQVRQYGVSSVKIYTTYGKSRLPDASIPLLMETTRDLGMVLMVHAENDDMIQEKRGELIAQNQTQPRFHPVSRPSAAETKTIETLIAMDRDTLAPLYIAHVSTGTGAQLIADAQQQELPVQGETCPHYLLLTDECYLREQAQKYVMTPPLRKEEDNLLLWDALQNNSLSCVSTDHCAFTLQDKLSRDNCFEILPGIGGSETLLPLLYSEGVRKNRISLEQMVQLLCTQPANIFQLSPKKGILSVGSDADIVVFDPEKEVVLRADTLHSNAGYTVFEDFKVTGYPVATFSRGKMLCRDGLWTGNVPDGQFIQCLG